MNNGDRPILIGEDNSDDVVLLRLAMKDAGIDPPMRVVADGQHVIDYLAGEGLYRDRDAHPLPRLLLLDLRMPKVGGLQVLEWIRRQPPPMKRLPVVVFTSSGEAADVDAAYELGANSFVRKPVQLEELTGIVTSLCSYWLTINTPPRQ